MGMKPFIQWVQDPGGESYVKLRIPRSWLAEKSLTKRKLQLWWWLTGLIWRLPP